MQETLHKHRTDSVEEKLSLLQAAHQAKDFDLALSLSESIKDTLMFERQMLEAASQGEECKPTLDANTFGRVIDLPPVWAEWARGWEFYKVFALSETDGMARSQEPIDLLVSFRADQITDIQREVRIARLETSSAGILSHALCEVHCQVYGEVYRRDERICHLVCFADVPAHGKTYYLVFYGNPNAELPSYTTDLTVSGEGFGLDIENHHYVAHLSRQMGQLERLTYKQAHGLELFAGGEGHGEPPNIDWAHDYLASEGFQKFRVTNWASCPNYEVLKGPLCVQVRRWGFPHSPVHPLFTPSRMHITVTYTFYAGLPYFLKEGSMDMVKDFEIVYLRDDEWVFSGYAFTDIVWMDSDGTLHEGAVPGGHGDNLWGVGFFNRQSRDAFIALWLEHGAENFDALYHSGAPTLNYHGHGQLWSRWAARNNPQFLAGARLLQKNAYLVSPYPEDGGAEMVQDLRHRLLNPLIAGADELPQHLNASAAVVPDGGKLARFGETHDTAPIKRAIWDALREVKDGMLYKVDANVVDMGYIYDVRMRGDVIFILMSMPHRGRPKYGFIANPIRERLLKLDGIRDVIVHLTWQPAWTVARLTDAGRKAMGIL